jgi:type II/III secretion system protein
VSRGNPRPFGPARWVPSLLATVCAVLLAGSVRGAPTPTPQPAIVLRVFTLKYKRPEEAALLVRPLLTENGSVILQPKLNTLTVRDSAAAVERTAQAIASWDVAPRAVEIAVTLLRASSDGRAPSKRDVGEAIGGVGEQLKKRFNFTDYEKLDSVVVQGTEGDTVSYVIGAEYRLEFLVEPSSDDRTIRLKNLTLERLRRDAAGREVKSEILKTSINVQVLHTYIYGIGKDEAASAALFLVFYPSWRAVPGIGVRN